MNFGTVKATKVAQDEYVSVYNAQIYRLVAHISQSVSQYVKCESSLAALQQAKMSGDLTDGVRSSPVKLTKAVINISVCQHIQQRLTTVLHP